SPYRRDRHQARALVPGGRFFEVHVHAPIEELRRRDPKGLYAREARGEVAKLPGSLGLYEEPREPELRIETDKLDLGQAARSIIERLEDEGIVPRIGGPGP